VLQLPIDGLLFDCDGVLVDSLEAAAVAWDVWAAEYAPTFDFRRDIKHGVRMSDTVAGLVAPELREQSERELIRLELESAGETVAMPGALELLSSLPVGSWAVVTSGVRDLAYARLAAAGLPIPGAVVTADDVTNGKPAPEPYLRGAALIGIDPSRCVVFEDAPAGLAAGRAAGVPTLVGIGDGARDAGATIVVPDLRSVAYANGVLRVATN
jgi:sugar-phosphatase